MVKEKEHLFLCPTKFKDEKTIFHSEIFVFDSIVWLVGWLICEKAFNEITFLYYYIRGRSLNKTTEIECYEKRSTY